MRLLLGSSARLSSSISPVALNPSPPRFPSPIGDPFIEQPSVILRQDYPFAVGLLNPWTREDFSRVAVYLEVLSSSPFSDS